MQKRTSWHPSLLACGYKDGGGLTTSDEFCSSWQLGRTTWLPLPQLPSKCSMEMYKCPENNHDKIVKGKSYIRKSNNGMSPTLFKYLCIPIETILGRDVLKCQQWLSQCNRITDDLNCLFFGLNLKKISTIKCCFYSLKRCYFKKKAKNGYPSLPFIWE